MFIRHYVACFDAIKYIGCFLKVYEVSETPCLLCPVPTSPEKLMYISCMIDVVNDKMLRLCSLQNGGHNPEFTYIKAL